MELGLTRNATAKLLGVNAHTVKHWEQGRHLEIRPTHWPQIIAFLTYNPLPRPATFGGRVRYERLSKGWSVKGLAKQANVDPATVRRIELDTSGLAYAPLRAVARALDLDATNGQDLRLSAELGLPANPDERLASRVGRDGCDS